MATTGRPLVAGLLGIGLMASACGGGSVETGVDGGLALDQDADADGDGVTLAEGDCNDLAPNMVPGGQELCDAIDNDCDGVVDEDLPSAWYYDNDEDGYGTERTAVAGCRQPIGYVAHLGDCDDQDDTVFPNAPERCDALDNDCNGSVDENPALFADGDGDGFGDPAAPLTSCDAGGVTNDGDCDDADAALHPETVWTPDVDGDGFGALVGRVLSCTSPGGTMTRRGGDCDDADPEVRPGAPERCNGVDNDCDGAIGEGLRVPEDYASINAALHAAPGHSRVCVGAGTFVEDLVMVWPVSVEGLGPGVTVLQGTGVRSVVRMNVGNGTARVQGMTIRGGRADEGAGIWLGGDANASYELHQLELRDHECSTSWCSGVAVYAQGVRVSLDHVDIGHLDVVGRDMNGAVAGDDAELTVVDTSFRDIHMDNGYALAISTNGGRASLERVRITNNASERNAQMLNFDRTLVSATNVDIRANSVGGVILGGILRIIPEDGEDSSFRNLAIAGNRFFGTPGISFAIGTAIWVGDFSSSLRGTVTFTNLDLTGNHTDAPDADVVTTVWFQEGTARFVNANIGNNHETTASGSRNGTVWVTAESGPAPSSIDFSSSNLFGGDLIMANSNADLDTHVPLPNPAGTNGNISVDPLYTDLSNSDPLLWDLRLQSSSQCINAGDPELLDADGTRSDIGAYGGPGGADW